MDGWNNKSSGTVPTDLGAFNLPQISQLLTQMLMTFRVIYGETYVWILETKHGRLFLDKIKI